MVWAFDYYDLEAQEFCAEVSLGPEADFEGYFSYRSSDYSWNYALDILPCWL